MSRTRLLTTGSSWRRAGNRGRTRCVARAPQLSRGVMRTKSFMARKVLLVATTVLLWSASTADAAFDCGNHRLGYDLGAAKIPGSNAGSPSWAGDLVAECLGDRFVLHNTFGFARARQNNDRPDATY